MMSAQNTLLTAISASERGVYEIAEALDLKELTSIVGRALAEPKDRQPRLRPPRGEEIDAIPLVGRSPAMQEIYRPAGTPDADRPHGDDCRESGTGKELVARALHDYGKRRNRTVRRGQHGGDPARAHRVRAVRPREGRLHGHRGLARLVQARAGPRIDARQAFLEHQARTHLQPALQQRGRAPVRLHRRS